MRIFSVFILWLILGVAAFGAERPKYIFFNIAPDRNRFYSEEAIRTAFDEIPKTVHVADNPRLRIGVSFIFSTLETPTAQIAQRIQTALECSEKTSTPVLITLDGQNWWETRSDLWNWWDPSKAGYNPSNVFNVERTGWSPTNAVKISWRNWGVIHRVAPAQNIASPAIIALQTNALRDLVPIIAKWYSKLPRTNQWLFGGVKLGWEAGIGYNAYYYPDGNHYREQWPTDPTHDPKYPLDLDKGLSSGVVQIGYAAVQSLGNKTHGEITREDLGHVVRWYLNQLCKTARDAGLPAELIFTHQGGTYKPWDKHLPFSAAINSDSIPGWSFYGFDPHEIPALARDMKFAHQQQWAACEWWWGASNATEWEDHFRRTLDFADCRFIDVYNWTYMFRSDLKGQEAVRNLIAR